MVLYGAVCYAIGMGALVYLILFTVALPGLPMPVTVDSGAPASLTIALLVNVGLAALFGLRHGIMARHGFKAAWTKIIPAAAERGTFVLATGLVIGCWATPDRTVSHLMLAVLLTAYILIGVAYEERDLIRAFGKSNGDQRALVLFPESLQEGRKVRRRW